MRTKITLTFPSFWLVLSFVILMISIYYYASDDRDTTLETSCLCGKDSLKAVLASARTITSGGTKSSGSGSD